MLFANGDALFLDKTLTQAWAPGRLGGFLAQTDILFSSRDELVLETTCTFGLLDAWQRFWPYGEHQTVCSHGEISRF